MRDEAERLVGWIQEKVREAGAQGGLVGLSGGIDSAVVAALLGRALPGGSLGVLMPCHSDPADMDDGALAARSAGIPTVTVDLDEPYDRMMAVLDPDRSGPAMAKANVKPRLRMNTLYYLASARGYLVVGTGNRTELELGYFTKYGDGGVDLLPLGEFLKHEVGAIAEELGVPRKIIDRAPSAGLWPGQTDEGEMGVTYDAVDKYLATGEAPDATRFRVEELRSRGRHKLTVAPVFPR